LTPSSSARILTSAFVSDGSDPRGALVLHQSAHQAPRQVRGPGPGVGRRGAAVWTPRCDVCVQGAVWTPRCDVCVQGGLVCQ
jgi:hypothetical protein